MGQARAVEIVFARLEDLRLRLQAAERGREHHPVAVLVKDAAVILAALGVEGVAQVLRDQTGRKNHPTFSRSVERHGLRARCGFAGRACIAYETWEKDVARTRHLSLLSPKQET